MSSESKQPNVYKEWLRDAALPSFVIQLVVSTLGAILAGVLVVLVPSILIATFTINGAGGNFADHVARQPFFVFLDEPYFIAPILSGFFLGWVGARFFRSSATVLVWIVPAAVLLISIGSGSGMDIWNTYFGKGCGASECAYEWFATLPFYTSVAYTIGWVTNFVLRKRRESGTYHRASH